MVVYLWLFSRCLSMGCSRSLSMVVFWDIIYGFVLGVYLWLYSRSLTMVLFQDFIYGCILGVYLQLYSRSLSMVVVQEFIYGCGLGVYLWFSSRSLSMVVFQEFVGLLTLDFFCSLFHLEKFMFMITKEVLSLK